VKSERTVFDVTAFYHSLSDRHEPQEKLNDKNLFYFHYIKTN